jgi:riboflavin kinase/FMN adenylyltransferase
MQVHRDIDNLPVFRKGVVTIGTFDGVHLGHCQIIAQLKEEAARIGGETIIITFHPHPRKVVASPSSGFQLLNTIGEKISLFENNGIDHLVIVPFTEAFSMLSAEDYIQQFLIGRFHPHTVIIGYDHRFGQGRKGDYKLLEKFSETLGYKLLEISPHVINSNTVSSTLIRKALSRGDISAANELLGYEYFITGKVVEGNKLGRTLGYPTANIEISYPEKLVPANGIYAVKLIDEEAPERLLKGMMSIGIRPTVDDSGIRTIEVNIFDFDRNIYGHTLKVSFVAYLREEKKFNGLEALKEQMAQDKLESLKILQ